MFDVYSLDTEFEIVYVFMSIDLLAPDRRDRPGIVVQEAGEEDYCSTIFTDDGKYIGAKIYMRDHEGAVEFSAYVAED